MKRSKLMGATCSTTEREIGQSKHLGSVVLSISLGTPGGTLCLHTMNMKAISRSINRYIEQLCEVLT